MQSGRILCAIVPTPTTIPGILLSPTSEKWNKQGQRKATQLEQVDTMDSILSSHISIRSSQSRNVSSKKQSEEMSHHAVEHQAHQAPRCS